MHLDHAPRRALLALLLSSLVACGDSATGPESTMVGEQGGTASLAGGSITLSVPAGALETSTDFTADSTDSVPSTDLLLGTAYQVGPGGTTFSRLATLTFAYEPSNLPDGVRQSELRLQKVAGDDWQSTIGSTVDSVAHVVKGQIDEVGTFGVVALPVAAVSLGPSIYTLTRGSTTQLSQTITGPSGQGLPHRRVTWASLDESVAAVDTAGSVTAVGAGSTFITASVEGVTAAARIVVYDCSAQTTIPQAQCLALIQIYDVLTNAEWHTQGGWISATDPCQWKGVSCSEGSVSGLDLAGGYKGHIPAAVADLVDLTTLRIASYDPLFSGPIPSVLGSLTKLEKLSLIRVGLTGSIPSELAQLSNLKELYLSINDLTGPIPPELGDLSGLTVLRLDHNQLTGAIPLELGKLSNLQDLDLFTNELTGTIPSQLSELTKLQQLELGGNHLTGSIPRELGSLANLTQLVLSDNDLSGPIPSELGKLSDLQRLALQGNDLSGVVPLSVAQLGGLMQSRYNSTVCLFVPPGNTGLTFPDTQEYRDADVNGDGKICNLSIGSQ